MIRKANVEDVRAIYNLLHVFAKDAELLPRPLGELYDHIRDFSVFLDNATGEMLGCCALHICWEDLAEVRSLAVDRTRWGKGIGGRLLEFALTEARELGIKKLFTLTYRPGFFEKHGFALTDKGNLPQKVWADCLKCVKFPDCDEIAMIREV
ncbi:MAG: N-acetyltransferase [Thermodesulfobacteriota bacterium]